MTSIYRSLRINHIQQETSDSKSFYLKEEGEKISYKSGQYLTLILPNHAEEIRRSYSIISSPVLHEPLAIGVKRIPNGEFSRWLVDKAKVGDKILTSGVGGFFTLPENINDYKQVFFLAAGSGITPVFSMIKTLLHSHPHISVVLIYSNRSVENCIYHDELENLAEKYQNNLKIEFLYSNLDDINRARLHRELLITFLTKYAVAEAEKTLAYTCGPIDYMRMCTYAFRLKGIPFDNIKQENFVPNKPFLLPQPPDKNGHFVHINVGKMKHTIHVQYPETILQAAKKQGVKLPYSCEAGSCGNCAARILQGKVWMSYNEILTEKDLQKGLTLTCVGYPVDGDVSLQIG
ncbi:MAG: ferredoxin--NADP reductase [Sphingobacteriales bacterium]|nr:MAG: ferredoxin--NADP reductase [Sphingobacteriales bacterium]